MLSRASAGNGVPGKGLVMQGPAPDHGRAAAWSGWEAGNVERCVLADSDPQNWLAHVAIV